MVHYKVQFLSDHENGDWAKFGGDFSTLEEALVKFRELDIVLTDSRSTYKDYLARIVKVTKV